MWCRLHKCCINLHTHAYICIMKIVYVYNRFPSVSVSVSMGVYTPIHDYSRKITLNSQLKSSTAPRFLFLSIMLKGVVLVMKANYLLLKNTKVC